MNMSNLKSEQRVKKFHGNWEELNFRNFFFHNFMNKRRKTIFVIEIALFKFTRFCASVFLASTKFGNIQYIIFICRFQNVRWGVVETSERSKEVNNVVRKVIRSSSRGWRYKKTLICFRNLIQRWVLQNKTLYIFFFGNFIVFGAVGNSHSWDLNRLLLGTFEVFRALSQ